MELILHAETRTEVGTAHSRRLRRDGERIPGVIYGSGKQTNQVTFLRKELAKLMQEENFFSHTITIHEGAEQEQVVLRDLQRHPAKGNVMHLDFLRISANRAVNVKIPLHFLNEDHCVGVKNQGGSIAHSITEVEISCLPDAIPDFIPVDTTNLDLRDAVHLSDLMLPEGVSIIALQHGTDADHDSLVVSVRPPRGGADEDEEQEAEETAAEPDKEETED